MPRKRLALDLVEGEPLLATSRIALVEVLRATAIANPTAESAARRSAASGTDEVVAYDRGLLEAAVEQALAAASPGAER